MKYDFSKSPEMALVKQKLFRAEIVDVFKAVSHALASAELPGLGPGQTVAIAAGSRGIDRIDQVVAACVKFFRDKGLAPFVVPAMGSHGGATAGGQKNVLEKLGIAASSIGAEIRADMRTRMIGETSSGVKIYFSNEALQADWILPVNRVRPHTKFKLPIESGLCKMLTIGLGKAEGAVEFHKMAVRLGFGILEEAAGTILKEQKVLGGLALMEDGVGKLYEIEAVPPGDMVAREKDLLIKSYGRMARIPFDDIDILVVDRMGKDISGIGMDSNVTGRHRDIVGDFHIEPHVKRIFVRRLSSGSDGNANGIGLADVVSDRLVQAMDVKKTFVNAVTAISPEKAAVPIHFETDLECLRVCAATAGPDDLETARIVRIRDTKNLEILSASRAFEPDVKNNDNLELRSDWKPFSFDEDGNLVDFQSTE